MFKKLINKKIVKTKWSDSAILFYLEDGSRVGFKPVGECCNEVYIEDIDDESVLQDCTILEIEEAEGCDEVGDTQWVFYKFKTSKGYATLSLRNEPGSSGYMYAGYLDKMDKNLINYYEEQYEYCINKGE